MNEVEIIARFEAASRAHDEAAKAVEAYFMPLLHEAIARRDEEAARAIVHRIPSDSVTKVFAFDAMRQAGFTLGGRGR